MKKNVKILSLLLSVAALVSCYKSDPEIIAEPPMESIAGYVTNEEGNALKGLRVEVFLDEQMTIPYNEGYYNIDENGNLYIDNEERQVHTDENGYYSFTCPSNWKQLQEPYKDLFIVVTDISDFYASQTQKGQIIYDNNSGVGNGWLDFVLYPQSK